MRGDPFRRAYAVVVLLLAVLALAGCRPKPISVATPEGFQPVKGQDWFFAVPRDWEVDRPEAGSEAAARDRRPFEEGGPRAELVRTSTSLPSRPFAWSRLRGTAVVVGSHEAAVGTLRAVDVEAIWSRDVPPARTLQRFLSNAGIGFQFTCGVVDAYFEQSRSTCAAIVGSFRLMP